MLTVQSSPLNPARIATGSFSVSSAGRRGMLATA
jgi:hypothetical protein